MKAHGSSILLGVRDMDRAKQFSTEGLGWKIKNDYGISVFFDSDGASPVGFYGREGLADQVGTDPEGVDSDGIIVSSEWIDCACNSRRHRVSTGSWPRDPMKIHHLDVV